MADQFLDVNAVELFAELEKQVPQVRLDWLASNSALVNRFRTDIARLAEDLYSNKPIPTEGTYKYNRGEELDKLFEKDRDSEAIRESNVRHFLINRVLDEFRPNIRRLLALPIERTINAFCMNQPNDVEQHALDVYDFVMDCLEHHPPISADLRWFWICVVTGDHANQNDDGQVRDNVRKFVDKCCTIFKHDVRSEQFKLFLLTLFEYDYAATTARRLHRLESSSCSFDGNASASVDGNVSVSVTATPSSSSLASAFSSASAAHKRNVPLNSVTDLDDFPLVYLLLCNVNSMAVQFCEHAHNKLDAVILDFLLKFNPADPEQSVGTSRLYARMVGLLLDALLFVELGSDPYHQITKYGQISEKLRNLLRKVRKQNNDEEWSTFVDMAGVPWIKEFADVIETPRKTVRHGLLGSQSMKKQKMMI